MTRVLLLSTYEMGHQPLGLAAPAAALRAAGHDVECADLAIESPSLEAVRHAELVGISMPMHTAARIAVRVAERVRQAAPDLPIVAYGLYAAPLHEALARRGLVDATVGGEVEPALVELANDVADGRPLTSTLGFARDAMPLPDRRGLPTLERYAQMRRADGLHLAGYVEASRGCAHTCTHCPITPVYGGRLRLVDAEHVLADIDAQVALGAEHITLGDPDFLNAVPHSMAILEEMHRRQPDVTFDVTVKVEHLVEHEALLPRLHELGCLFVTSAFESLDDEVLVRLEKGHMRADIERALDAAERAGVVVRPTWMAFTPWTTLEGFAALLDFVERRGLVHHVQAVQFALRLLVPPGSALLPQLEAAGVLDEFDDEALTYRWTHPDARVDALQLRVASIVEEAASLHDHAGALDQAAAEVHLFARIKAAALEALGRDATGIEVVPQPRRVVPGLTESWFC
ncbi:MAG: CUAEP/CCAEP-tail radical SAM protein [Dehalococcoidia bacterium]